MNEKSYQADICNICGSTKFHQIHFFKEWGLGRNAVQNVAIVKCGGCGVRRRSPGIVDDYEEAYHSTYVGQGQSIHPHQLSHFADLMTARLRRFNEAHVDFLDVGCSTGRVLRLATTLGFTVMGLDYSAWAAKHCSELGFDTRHGSLLGQWDEAARFDVIHCSHTIEHVPDPLVYIQEMSRLLRPGGHLMLAFPNYASLPRVMLRKKWGTWCLDSHLWQFTARQMCGILQANGFSIFTCHTHHGYSPDSRLKRRVLDWAATLGFGDGCNIVAIRQ